MTGSASSPGSPSTPRIVDSESSARSNPSRCTSAPRLAVLSPATSIVQLASLGTLSSQIRPRRWMNGGSPRAARASTRGSLHRCWWTSIRSTLLKLAKLDRIYRDYGSRQTRRREGAPPWQRFRRLAHRAPDRPWRHGRRLSGDRQALEPPGGDQADRRRPRYRPELPRALRTRGAADGGDRSPERDPGLRGRRARRPALSGDAL